MKIYITKNAAILISSWESYCKKTNITDTDNFMAVSLSQRNIRAPSDNNTNLTTHLGLLLNHVQISTLQLSSATLESLKPLFYNSKFFVCCGKGDPSRLSLLQ